MAYFLLAVSLFSGITGKIQGTVKDEATGKTIPYADVVILNTETGAATDDNGNFFILNVPPGQYTLEISCLGYQTKRIENVIVEVDQTFRLKAIIKQTSIDMAPVVISGTTPAVKKDMVGSTYIIHRAEISALPIDYVERLIAFQPSVANVDTALHVRGGRATEVLYMIDNVSIIDPQTGDPAINISKGIIDEVIFLPGGFDVEYGRAMSGVVNLITEHPKDKLSGRVFGKTETIMPFYYDFGYQDYQASLHLPISPKFKGLIAADLMHTDDWDPRLFILPHKQRDDYALYGKWLAAPSGKLRINLSGALSRSQFDRYPSWKFKYRPDHWRSDWRKGDMQSVIVNYIPDSKKLISLTISRLFNRTIFGVRNAGPFGIFEDFTFRNYNTYKNRNYSNKTPFGVYSMWGFASEGDYNEYEDMSSRVFRVNLNADIQAYKNHELKGGTEYSRLYLKNFHYFVSNDTMRPIADDYQYEPVEAAVFLQDNIEYEGLYAKAGLRYEYFSTGTPGIPAQQVISPRIGVSFQVTEKFLFRANIGKYAQMPLYDQLYRWYQRLPFPDYIYYFNTIGVIGNPRLRPEKTISYEIGMQGEIRQGLSGTVNAFYKDISDLVGSRFIPATPRSHILYFNVEQANVKGVETIVDFTSGIFTGKISYTLSWAMGTSSYANEVYERYYKETLDTTYVPSGKDYLLDFDQRHRFFIQGAFSLPYKTQVYVFSFLGRGFPYTPPGPEGKVEEKNSAYLPFRHQIDFVVTKGLSIGKIDLNLNIELINALDERYQIAPHRPNYPLEKIYPWEFDDYYPIFSDYYHPAADFNHDGVITPQEEYTAYVDMMLATDDWVPAYSSPRRARIGCTVNF